jgi:hypothetical protein
MQEDVKNEDSDEGIYPLSVELPSLKSLFIEMYFGDQKLSTGTAVLVAKDRSSHCALVTNRHNVTGRNLVGHKPATSIEGISCPCHAKSVVWTKRVIFPGKYNVISDYMVNWLSGHQIYQILCVA